MILMLAWRHLLSPSIILDRQFNEDVVKGDGLRHNIFIIPHLSTKFQLGSAPWTSGLIGEMQSVYIDDRLVRPAHLMEVRSKGIVQ